MSKREPLTSHPTRSFNLTADEMAAVLSALSMWISLAGCPLNVSVGDAETMVLTEPERMIAAYKSLQRQLTAQGQTCPDPDFAWILAHKASGTE